MANLQEWIPTLALSKDVLACLLARFWSTRLELCSSTIKGVPYRLEARLSTGGVPSLQCY
eukprot:1156119-Pelagomonas_calceolata.AAC.13